MLLCLAGNICFLFLQHTSVLLYIIFHPFHYMHYTPNTFLNRVLIVWTWSLERCSVSEKGVFTWTCSRWHLKGFFECTVAIRQAGVGAEAGASPSLSTRHCSQGTEAKATAQAKAERDKRGRETQPGSTARSTQQIQAAQGNNHSAADWALPEGTAPSFPPALLILWQQNSEDLSCRFLHYQVFKCYSLPIYNM